MTSGTKAYLTITRNKSYLLLLGIIFVLSQLLFLGYFIDITNQRAITKVKSQVGPTVIAVVDQNKIEHGIVPFTKDRMLEISKLPEVLAYDYKTSIPLLGNQIKKVQTEGKKTDAPFYFIGIQYPKMTEIETKSMALIQGRTFTQEEIAQDKQVVIISQELLEKNNLQLNDSVIFDYIQYEPSTSTKLDNEERTISQRTPYEFEIIGTYKKQEKLELNDMRLPEEYLNNIKDKQVNEIYTTNNAIAKIKKESAIEFNEEKYFGNVTFLLNSMDDISSFTENAKMYLPESYMFIGTNDAGEMIQNALQSSQNIGQMVMFLTIAISIILSSFVLTLIFKQRKKEFGIYLALGIKKIELIKQVLFELYTIGLIALLLSFSIFHFIMPGITESIIRTELYNTSTEREVPKYGIEALEVDQSAEAYIEPVILIEDYAIIVVGVFVIITASSIMLIYQILRYPVKNILLDY
ncbi:MAG: FtsX-like permease family protein [Culicoidibacterales bacterium]